MRIANVWGSLTGSTERAAERLRAHPGDLVDSIQCVADISMAEMHVYDEKQHG